MPFLVHDTAQYLALAAQILASCLKKGTVTARLRLNLRVLDIIEAIAQAGFASRELAWITADGLIPAARTGDENRCDKGSR